MGSPHRAALQQMGIARDTSCPCGSGKKRFELKDARGISCGFVCDYCEAAKRARYRPEIFTDGGYWHNEPLEENQ